MTIAQSELALKVKGLRMNFYTYEGVVKALDGVEIRLKRGDTMGIVGETGCGKSVTAKCILRLIEPPGRIEGGQVLIYDTDPQTGKVVERDILKLTTEEMLDIRGNRISIVFQDPATYPNPVFRVGDQIAEVVLLHQDLRRDALQLKIDELRGMLSAAEGDATQVGEHKDSCESGEPVRARSLSPEKMAKIREQIAKYESMLENPPKPDKKYAKKAAMRRAIEMLRMVKMPSPDRVAMQYPHELSGGMRQRALIAMALASNPLLLICDEATTALDVTVQAQVLNLLNELKKEIGSSIMIITHDLGVVAETCNSVTVMYAGNTVESASTKELFENPVHPYTIGLLQAIPKLHENKERLDQILGTVPNLINPPSGCRFHPRCEYATAECSGVKPELKEVRPGHWVACYHPQGRVGGE
ncbi:MAG: ABC transporter ATP-binding protein [Candidatus Thorarchaeota archaeon]|nr:ABC transporter ATP-binding protein [Candidatus Thorarchaeota archaeon]